MYIFIQKHLQYKIIVSLKGEFYDINRKIRKLVVKVHFSPIHVSFSLHQTTFLQTTCV